MNVLSLFSGVGGFDLGLENAGMKTIYQCEWDKHATRILERHWPTVPRWGDISTLTAKEILRHGTPPDVVAWGSPCQDLSVAGKRAGLEGERSGLFHEGIRIINELRKETNNEYPRISIWENVAGALSSNRGADFGTILDEMAKAGAMVIEWGMLDAQFWVPQRRKRIFVIAIFDPATASRCPSPLLPLSESLPRDTSQSKQKRKNASRTLTESFGDGGGIVNAIGASIYHKSTVVNQDVSSGHLVVGSLAARDYKGVGNQYVNENKCVVESSAAYGIQGNVIGRQDHNGPSGMGITQEDGPMFTLTKTDIHAVADRMVVRRLTPDECCLLMGWEMDWNKYYADGSEQPDMHRYKQAGNGVASPVAEWIGKQLMKLDEAPQ